MSPLYSTYLDLPSISVCPLLQNGISVVTTLLIDLGYLINEIIHLPETPDEFP